MNVVYKVTSENPITNDDYLRLFKEKEVRDIFIRYLEGKKINTVMLRGQAPSEEAEFRR